MLLQCFEEHNIDLPLKLKGVWSVAGFPLFLFVGHVEVFENVSKHFIIFVGSHISHDPTQAVLNFCNLKNNVNPSIY